MDELFRFFVRKYTFDNDKPIIPDRQVSFIADFHAGNYPFSFNPGCGCHFSFTPANLEGSARFPAQIFEVWASRTLFTNYQHPPNCLIFRFKMINFAKLFLQSKIPQFL